ncbi:unnamed protein product, partial [Laminaria digitata]
GLVGVVDNNTLVAMFPGTTQWQVNAEERLFKPDWKGFLCPLRTSLRPSGGCWRSIVSNVGIRVCNEQVVSQLEAIGVAVSETTYCSDPGCGDGQKLRMWLGGVSFSTCGCFVEVMRSVFTSTRDSGCNRVTFHQHSNGEDLVVSYSTGALMKPLHDAGYVDSVMLSQDVQRWLSTSAADWYHGMDVDGVPLFSSLSSMTPFQNHNPPARAALSSHYIAQAICLPRNTMNYSCTPLYREEPLVVTAECLRVFEELDTFPGLNVRVAFMQTDLTYEDAFVMSASCASRFRYESITTIPVSESARESYPDGTGVQPRSEKWWPIPVPGVVVGASVTSMGDIRMSVSRRCTAVTGDKFTTSHGQKGVVTVVPDRLMPVLPCGDVAEVIVGSTTLMKRGTVGQLME